MTSFAGQIWLESVLVPAVVSGLIVLTTRWLRHRVSLVLVYAIAFLAAIAASYVMVFGWPTSTTLGARQKIALLTCSGLLIGIVVDLRNLRFLLPSILVAGPLWIGWPLLIQGSSKAVLLILPLIIPLLFAATLADDRSRQSAGKQVELFLLLIIMASGLSMIALFARTLSFMQLGLALASTLAAILLAATFLTGRKPPELLLPIAGTTMLSGLLTALLLYSEANLTAIILLSGVLLLPHLHTVLSESSTFRTSAWTTISVAMTIASASVCIAWIDAGSISVY